MCVILASSPSETHSVGIILEEECVPEHQVETKLRLTRSPLSQALDSKNYDEARKFVSFAEEGFSCVLPPMLGWSRFPGRIRSRRALFANQASCWLGAIIKWWRKMLLPRIQPQNATKDDEAGLVLVPALPRIQESLKIVCCAFPKKRNVQSSRKKLSRRFALPSSIAWLAHTFTDISSLNQIASSDSSCASYTREKFRSFSRLSKGSLRKWKNRYFSVGVNGF